MDAVVHQRGKHVPIIYVLEHLLKFQIQKRKEGMNVNVEEIAEELKIKTKFINRYNWLFAKYQDHCYYWELVQTARKVFIVLIGKFLTKRIILSLSLHLGCLVIMYGAHSYNFPYEEIDYEDDSDKEDEHVENVPVMKKCKRICVKKCNFYLTTEMSNNFVEYLFLNGELFFLLSCLIRNILMIEISNEERQNNVTNANMLNSTMSIPEKLLAKSKGSYSFIVISEWLGLLLFVIAISIFVYQVSFFIFIFFPIYYNFARDI